MLLNRVSQFLKLKNKWLRKKKNSENKKKFFFSNFPNLVEPDPEFEIDTEEDSCDLISSNSQQSKKPQIKKSSQRLQSSKPESNFDNVFLSQGSAEIQKKSNIIKSSVAIRKTDVNVKPDFNTRRESTNNFITAPISKESKINEVINLLTQNDLNYFNLFMTQLIKSVPKQNIVNFLNTLKQGDV